jgi:hypothetical protein
VYTSEPLFGVDRKSTRIMKTLKHQPFNLLMPKSRSVYGA